MKNILVLFVCTFFAGNILFAQQFSINGLEKLVYSKSFSEINSILLNKQWTNYTSSTNLDYNEVSWGFNMVGENYAEEWLTIYFENNSACKIRYQMSNSDDYSSFRKGINNYNLVYDSISNDKITSKYVQGEFILQIIVETGSENNTPLVYLIKHNSLFDQDNGAKIIRYDNNNSIHYKYSLKNGKLNGEFIEYDIPGEVIKKGAFKDGKKNGVFEKYDNGELISKIEYKDDLQNGLSVYYNKKLGFNSNVVIIDSIYFLNGILNGPYKRGLNKLSASDKRKIIWDCLRIEQFYDKTYENFYYDFSNLKNRKLLYELLCSKFLYLGSFSEFNEKIWDNSDNFNTILAVGNCANGQKNGELVAYKPLGSYSQSGINYFEIGLWPGSYSANKENYLNGLEHGLSENKNFSWDICNLGVITNFYIRPESIEYGNYINGEIEGNWVEEHAIPFKNLYSGKYMNNNKTGKWFCYIKEPNSMFYDSVFYLETYNNDNTHIKEQFYSYEYLFNSVKNEFFNYDTIVETIIFPEYTYETLNQLDYRDGLFLIKDSLGIILEQGIYEYNSIGSDNNNSSSKKNGFWIESVLVKDFTCPNRIDFQKQTSIRNCINCMRVFARGEYNMGKKNGIWEYSTDSSNIFLIENYVDNVINGEQLFFESNILQQKRKYDQGILKEFDLYSIKDSVIKKTYEKIKVDTSSVSFRVSIYFEDGSVLKVEKIKYYDYHEFVDSDFINIRLYKSDIKTVLENFYVSDKYNCIVDLISENFLATDNGEYYYANPDKTQTISGNYKLGKKTGIWVEEYADFIIKYDYANGIQSPKSETFYDKHGNLYNGQISLDYKSFHSTIQLKNGIRHGKTKIYDIKSNKLVAIDKYKNGIRVN